MKKITMKLSHVLLLVGWCLSSLAFTSCDKEETVPTPAGTPTTGTPPVNPNTPSPIPTPPSPVTTNHLLKQLGTQLFAYDAQQRLVEVSYADQPTLGYKVVYEGNRPVRLNFNAGGNYLLYTYQGDKVVEAVRYYGESRVNYRHTFAYSGDRLVKATTMSYARYDEGRLTVTEYRYDANGNLTELLQATSTSNLEEDLGQPFSITWGDYDAKPNPMPYAGSDYLLPGVKLFRNNPGYRDPGNGKESYTYTYHESGMPKQRSIRYEALPQTPAVVQAYQYQ